MNSADLSWILHTVKMILPTVNDTAYGVRKKNSLSLSACSDLGYLSGLANHLSSQALAPTTFRLYNRAFREFRLFCWHAELRFTPISEHNLLLHTTFLNQRISSKSIRTFWQASNSCPLSLVTP